MSDAMGRSSSPELHPSAAASTWGRAREGRGRSREEPPTNDVLEIGTVATIANQGLTQLALPNGSSIVSLVKDIKNGNVFPQVGCIVYFTRRADPKVEGCTQAACGCVAWRLYVWNGGPASLPVARPALARRHATTSSSACRHDVQRPSL